jgi:parallel beta-helix repeat protein
MDSISDIHYTTIIMKKLFFHMFLLGLAIPSAVVAQYVVSDYSDIGDSVMNDGLYFPHTLRSAIQNANYKGIPATIEFLDDNATIKVGTPLPPVNIPMQFKGDGLTIEPSTKGAVNQGLVFQSNNSIIRTTIIQNFGINGLVWKGSDGRIENVKCRNNGTTNLQFLEAHRNIVSKSANIDYASNQFYGGQYGITLYRSNDNIIEYSFVGIDGIFTDLGNSLDGIYVDKCNRTTIRNNTISGNGGHGIFIDGFSSEDITKFHSSDNTVEHNYIGTNSNARTLTAIANAGGGVLITNSTDDSVHDNIISGNTGTGIQVQSQTPGTGLVIDGRVVIENNSVGVDHTTLNAIANGRGIYVSARKDIVRNNVISGNTGIGIEVVGPENIIQSNIIGLDSSQTVAVPNGIGIAVDNRSGPGLSVIGDTTGGAGNIVAGNKGGGIYVYGGGPAGGGTQDVVVSRNTIGANKDTIAFPNGGPGIYMKYNVAKITAKENLISANGGDGIRIERNVVRYLDTTRPPLFQRPSNITIKDNCIGCIRSGDTTGKHGGSGIFIFNADSIFIDNNTINGTAGDGITVTNDSTRVVEIVRNRIGPVSGGSPLLIGGDGIRVSGAVNVTIGNALRSGDSNSISFCKGHGVSVADNAQKVFVYSNSFFNNELGGIGLDDLKKYFTDNKFSDALDADHGSNDLQNTIEQYSGSTQAPTLRLSGSFHGKPNKNYSADVYLANAMLGGIEYKTQGSIHLGWFSITTNAQGLFALDTVWDDPLVSQYAAAYPFVTVTMTGEDGTSSFSHLTPLPGVDIVVTIDSTRSKVEAGGIVTIVAIIENLGGDPATTVSVRDTVSDFELQSVTISKGVASIVDSTFIATIPSLSNGETIEYKAIGRMRSPGVHRRKILAIPSETDMNPANNSDTISMNIINLNDVETLNESNIYIKSVSGRAVSISGLRSGTFIVQTYNLLGQLFKTMDLTLPAPDPITISLIHGVNLIQITRDGLPVFRRMIVSED